MDEKMGGEKKSHQCARTHKEGMRREEGRMGEEKGEGRGYLRKGVNNLSCFLNLLGSLIPVIHAREFRCNARKGSGPLHLVVRVFRELAFHDGLLSLLERGKRGLGEVGDCGEFRVGFLRK